MTTSTEEDWSCEAAKGDNTEEAARVDAPRNSSVQGDFLDVSFMVEHTPDAAQRRSSLSGDTSDKKAAVSLDGDSNLSKDLPPGVVVVPEFSDTSFSPQHNITPDSFEASSSEGEDSSYGPPSYSPLPTILEEPELEEQLEMEDTAELNLDKLRGHTEEEPAPLLLEKWAIDGPELSTEPTPESPEPKLQMPDQWLAEFSIYPEAFDIVLMEDEATNTAEEIVVEDLPVTPTPSDEMCDVLQVPAQTVSTPEKQAASLGAHSEVAPVSVDQVQTPRSVGAEASPPAMAKDTLANLEKTDQLGGTAVLYEGGHDTCTLPEDLMSIEGAQMQIEKCEKEDLGELSIKEPVTGGQPSLKLQQASSQDETDVASDDEECLVDIDNLPVRSRIDIWKRRECRAVRKGMIVVPKVKKQGRFPTSSPSP